MGRDKLWVKGKFIKQNKIVLFIKKNKEQFLFAYTFAAFNVYFC